jgi:hypothetical protein
VRDAAVSVVVDGENNNLPITAILVSGRPEPHPFPGGEGRHTTAWVVYVDTIRRLLVGQGLVQAATILQQLITDEANFAARFTAQQLGQARSTRRADAERAATEAVAAGVAAAAVVPTNQAEARRELQKAIAKYLALRNLAPLAGAYTGAGDAPGGGEASALVTLRAFESDRTLHTAAKVRAAVLKLLDLHTLLWVMQGRAAVDTMPGLSNDRAATVWSVVSRHLTQIATAYPVCYAACGLSTATTLHGEIISFPGLGGLAQPAIVLPLAVVGSPLAPVGWASTAGTGGCTVTLTLNDAGTMVTGIHAPERGKTLLATQGHHLTAHIAVVCAVEHAIKNKALASACTDLLQLVDDLEQLPTFPPIVAIRIRSTNVDAPMVKDGGDPKLRLPIAWGQLVKAKEQAQNVERGMEAIVMQDLASAYLSIRNLLPLAAVNYGSPAEGHGERVNRLRAWEGLGVVPDAEVAQALTDLWKLFDSNLLGDIFNPHQLNDFAPGADRDGFRRVVDALKVHLITAKAAWPICCAQVGLETKWSVCKILGANDMLELNTEELYEALEITVMGEEFEFTEEIGAQKVDPTEASQPLPPSLPLDEEEVVDDEDLSDRTVGSPVGDDDFIVPDG